MSVGEFQIIEKYFHQLTPSRDDVHTAIGDDCALLLPDTNKLLAVSTDTLVAGVHFFEETDAFRLGYKSLAVNLSDLAAMGAEPCWLSLALTMPEVNEVWLSAFSKGLASLAKKFGIQLIGGDITKGPLSITLTVHGKIEAEKVLTRSGARPGDLLYVSGQLGSAALALKKYLLNEDSIDNDLKNALEIPEPRVLLGESLAGLATSCIDISDGLVADLGHICEVSDCGASIYLEKLPCNRLVKEEIEMTGNWEIPLNGGEDYELCFTVSPASLSELDLISTKLNIDITRIGEMTDSKSVAIYDRSGEQINQSTKGFTHF